MVTKHVRGNITWIDLEAPTTEELHGVMQEYGIDPRIEEEIMTPTPYPLTIATPDYLYLILHFPTTDPRGGARDQEIDLIVGKHFLITTRYEVIDSIHTLHRVFEAEELMGRSEFANIPTLLELVLRRLYGAIREEMDDVARRLERIERDIFSGQERAAVRTISNINRILLRFDTVLDRHEEPLDAFLSSLMSHEFFGKNFKTTALRVTAEHDHVDGLVRSYRAIARELRITNDSLLTSSQNEVMKVLTIMAFVTFPLTLISSIFGMNTEHLPIVGTPGDFWIILGMMITLAVAFFTFFRYKKWL